MRSIDTANLDFDGAKAFLWENGQKQTLPSLEQLLIYNGLDSALTHEILPRTYNLSPNQALTYGFSRALLAPAMDMMLRGVRVDMHLREEALVYLDKAILETTKLAHDKVSEIGYFGAFSPTSNKDLSALFYDHIGIPPIMSYTKGEQKRTIGAPALKKILDEYPALNDIVETILSVKSLQKMRGTLKMRLRDGRFHASFNQTAETGRWTSSKGVYGDASNAQNIAPEIRIIFTADPGYKLAYIDLQSAESVCVAYISGDEAYIYATTQSDVHTIVATMCYPQYQWSGDTQQDRAFAEATYITERFNLRDLSKRGGHGSNYFGTPFAMAQALKIPMDVAEEFQHVYFTAFPGIPGYHHSVARLFADTPEDTLPSVTTPFGRTRQFFGRPNDKATLREAIADIPQSMTADALNLGMYRVWRDLRQYDVQLLLQVHDAILCQFPESLENQLIPIIQNKLEVQVPVRGRIMHIKSDAQTGWNWAKRSDTNPDGLADWNPNAPPRIRSANPHRTFLTSALKPKKGVSK